MRKAKVLIVDDAALIRRVVSDVLSAEPSIEVVGDAANGRIALEKIAQLTPDVITLDLEMPVMDGLTTLRELRKTHPRLPVIMVSSHTERGATDTLEALHSGASDYVTKPSIAGGRQAAQDRIRADLVPKIKSLCKLGVPADTIGRRPPHGATSSSAPPVMRPLGAPIPAEVVAVGLSTGGPNAIQNVLSHLTAGFPAPIVLVQHMPQMFTKYLAERLNAHTPLTVVEATDGGAIEPGVVYVAPGDYHLTLRRAGRVVSAALDQTAPQHSHRPAIDVLFRSVADAYGPRALGVVMTGMGQDALHGSESIMRAGGRVIVQDEASSVVWEMAASVVRAGVADAVFPLDALAPELVRRTAGAAERTGSRKPAERPGAAASGEMGPDARF